MLELYNRSHRWKTATQLQGCFVLAESVWIVPSLLADVAVPTLCDAQPLSRSDNVLISLT